MIFCGATVIAILRCMCPMAHGLQVGHLVESTFAVRSANPVFVPLLKLSVHEGSVSISVNTWLFGGSDDHFMIYVKLCLPNVTNWGFHVEYYFFATVAKYPTVPAGLQCLQTIPNPCLFHRSVLTAHFKNTGRIRQLVSFSSRRILTGLWAIWCTWLSATTVRKSLGLLFLI